MIIMGTKVPDVRIIDHLLHAESSVINEATILEETTTMLRKEVDTLSRSGVSLNGKDSNKTIAFTVLFSLIRENGDEIKLASASLMNVPEEYRKREPYTEFTEIINAKSSINASLLLNPDVVIFDSVERIRDDLMNNPRVVMDVDGTESRKASILEAIIEAIKSGWPYA